MTQDNVAVQIQGLTKRFGNFVAVNDLSLVINQGEIFSLLGPNGAGKTTTVNMLCCLLNPTSGTARVLGHDVVRQSHEVKRVIGVCPQETVISDRLSAWENMELMGRLQGMWGRRLKQAAASLLRQVGLAERSRDRVRKYSGGMKRRLSLAMALLHDPPVLFLDEPTLGMDPQGRRAIWDYISSLRRAKTVLLTTNYMDEADALSDRIGIIDQGKLVALGTPRDLKASLVAREVLTIELASSGTDAAEALRRRYSQVSQDGRTIRVAHDRLDFREVVECLYSAGGTATSVSFEQPTLEDVFLRLTGRGLRD